MNQPICRKRLYKRKMSPCQIKLQCWLLQKSFRKLDGPFERVELRRSDCFRDFGIRWINVFFFGPIEHWTIETETEFGSSPKPTEKSQKRKCQIDVEEEFCSIFVRPLCWSRSGGALSRNEDRQKTTNSQKWIRPKAKRAQTERGRERMCAKEKVIKCRREEERKKDEDRRSEK